MTDQPQQEQAPATLEGAVPPLVTPAERRRSMDQAFDYRGDVTIHTTDGRVIEGYVFDRRSTGPDADHPYVRLIPTDGDEPIRIQYADIARLVFTGRDTAAGKSWQTWVKTYYEKKMRGEAPNLEPEPLE